MICLLDLAMGVSGQGSWQRGGSLSGYMLGQILIVMMGHLALLLSTAARLRGFVSEGK